MINGKPVIGIVGRTNFAPYDPKLPALYEYPNSIIKRVVERNCVPLLVPYSDEKVLPDALDMCDALILPGGFAVRPQVFDVIAHFAERNKPILGICLGMQTLGMYSVNIETQGKRILKPVDKTVFDHCKLGYSLHNPEAGTTKYHSIEIYDDTRLKEIYKCDTMEVNSSHNQTITEVGSSFKISAKSPDGIIEGIECKDPNRFIVGVQFHPESIDDLGAIFDALIAAIK